MSLILQLPAHPGLIAHLQRAIPEAEAKGQDVVIAGFPVSVAYARTLLDALTQTDSVSERPGGK